MSGSRLFANQISFLAPVLAPVSVLVLMVGLLTACTPAQFEELPSAAPGKASVPTPTPAATPLPGKTVTEVFTQDDSANKVDILVVNDNSYSMEVEQTKMAERFPSFVSALGDLDYQISMTTTDIDSKDSRLNLGGRAVNWAGTTSKVLTPATLNASDVFKNTIRRSETIGCVKRGDCPSGNEQPLKASMLAMDQRFTENAGIFRDNVDLAIVVLSDEDELSDAPVAATHAKDVVDRFQAHFGRSKSVRAFGIVIQTGDDKCLKSQMKQTASGNGAHVATRVEDLTKLTGGSTNSICDADYSKSLTDISKSVRRLVGTFALSSAPKGGSVKVVLTPAPVKPIAWKIEGQSLIFEAPPAAGTRVEVIYEQ